VPAIAPFRIHVDETVLDDLRQRLSRTRWPDQLPEAGWDYGTELGYLRELCEYWRTSFDWRAVERRLNDLPHFVVEIDRQRIHFVHVRSREPQALPLILLHGWPGSFVEYLQTIGPLADPVAHGGEAADAFDVVVPSLPGYGFSGPTVERGVDARGIAGILAELMGRLGYDRYVAQGGDWGARVTRALATIDVEHLAGIHLNTFTPRPEDPTALAAKGERVWEMPRSERGYQAIQATKPQTLAYGLTDSPAGLAAWIVEKFRAWSDCGGDIERSFTKDELLTNITLYWVTGTINSANRLYYEEGIGSPAADTHYPPVSVPSAFACYPGDISRPSREWVERSVNLVHWTEQPRGGHFAAMEEPELFVADVRAFARKLRASS
jgi:microsomal epoxide hydrolase